MSQKLSYFLFLFLCFSLNTCLNAQTQNDSLAKYSFEELEKKFYDTRYTNKESCEIYAKEYLSKAKLYGDKIKISRGYFHMAIFNDLIMGKLLISIKYTDSIIETCNDCNDKEFPALGYHSKGIYLYLLNKDKEALKSLFKTLDILNKSNNVQLEIDTRNTIITIKENWGANKETIKYQKNLLEFIKKQRNYELKYKYEYALAIFNLSCSYLRVGEYEKGLELSKYGVYNNINHEKDVTFYDFVSNAGTAQYYLGNYQAAIDSSLKALPYMKDHGKAMRNYYLGKSYNKLNQPEKAQFHFLKTDSIYQATKDIFPEMRIAYQHIIEYYKSKNDAENQIKYYDRLLETDKVIDSTYTYVKETIEKKYETPQAIAERARLVAALETKKSAWKYRFAAISAILLVILGILVAAFRRQKYYKQRFENLMNTSAPLNVQKTNSEVTETGIERSRNALDMTTETKDTQEKDLGVPQEIIDTILSQLKKFETSQKFTKQVSITSLAKNLKTNPKYLSKVINWHYKKNFSHYISELRIEYVISRLKEDSKFRNYTIKAIAKEAGFGNTESFSKAFLKSTGIKPSYFIKELQKRFES